MIDELLSVFALEGWLVNNLYQVDSGLWRANLRKDDGEGAWFTSWAEAPTAFDALWEAFEQSPAAEFAATPETHSTIDRSPAPSLLARLGLAKPTKIERRI